METFSSQAATKDTYSTGTSMWDSRKGTASKYHKRYPNLRSFKSNPEWAYRKSLLSLFSWHRTPESSTFWKLSLSPCPSQTVSSTLWAWYTRWRCWTTTFQSLITGSWLVQTTELLSWRLTKLLMQWVLQRKPTCKDMSSTTSLYVAAVSSCLSTMLKSSGF